MSISSIIKSILALQPSYNRIHHQHGIVMMIDFFPINKINYLRATGAPISIEYLNNAVSIIVKLIHLSSIVETMNYIQTVDLKGQSQAEENKILLCGRMMTKTFFIFVFILQALKS